MARPDLSTPEGLTAYRAELRGVAQPVRMAAFALVLIGAAVVVAMATSRSTRMTDPPS